MKILILIASILYYLFVSLGHDFITQKYVKVFHLFGRQKMELGLMVLSVTIALFIAFFVFFKSKKTQSFIDKKSIFIAVASLIFCHQVLIVTNVEMVHFFQYMILSFLLCLLIKDLRVVMYLVLFAGIVDEFFQFFLFPAYTKYLDFNDFVLNLVGAYIGILVFSLFSIDRYHLSKQIKMESIYWFLFVSFSVFLVLYHLGFIVLYASVPEIKSVFVTIEDQTAFALSFYRHENFWEITSYGKKYHTLTILDGVLTISFLCALFQSTLKVRSAEVPNRAKGHFSAFDHLKIIKIGNVSKEKYT